MIKIYGKAIDRSFNHLTFQQLKNILPVIFLFFISIASVAQEVKKIKITELEKTIKESKGPLIVNFWATYCVTCLEELPYYHEMTTKYKSSGLRLLLVSLDMQAAYPKQINTIAKKFNLTAPIFWLDETNADYFCPKVDSSWSGGLPSSLFINNATGYRKFFEDKVAREKLEEQIQAMITSKK